ncbi:MAG: GldG family protein [Nitrospirae bacterium]|nr:GldG family protein [Nitrospirota bacterium]
MAGRRAIWLTRWGLLAATLGVLVLLNLLAGGWFLRLDLTADKEFTPSQGTVELLASLDDDLVVRGYFSANLPAPYNRARQVLKDLLDEYRALSHGHLRYEFIDPAELDDDPERAMALVGIPMVQVTDVSSDKMQVVNGFMGAVVLYEDKQEIVPVIQDGGGLEFALTAKIRKLTGHGRKQVGLLQGFGAPDLDALSQMVPLLGEQYVVQAVDLEAGDPLPDGLDVLLINGPTAPLSPWALARIDGFLAGGGGVAVLSGGVDAELATQHAQDLPELFDGLLEKWGVTIARDLVADANNVRITVAQRRGIFTLQNMVEYPYIPLLHQLSRDNPVVAGLEGMFTPFVSSLRVNPVEGITHTPLAESSGASWRVTAPYDINPLMLFAADRLPPSAKGPHVVALAAQGAFPSVYAGRQVTGPDGATQAVAAPAPAPGRLLVVGSGLLLSDAYLLNGENAPLLLNAIDWLARDEGLIGLRSRGVTDRPLAKVSDAAREGIKTLNILGGALLLIVTGLVRWRLRQARRRRLAGMV